MLKAHLDAVEQHLLHVSRIPANAGHTLHRGTPREAFIKEFLTNHLSAKLAVGTGEIIDASSLPREPRNQFDIVIYKAEYPKLHLGGEVNAFLAESVVATIEVKSLLTDKDLDSAIGNASRAKKLTRNLITSFTSGYVPPGILSYVIAYDGPKNMSTAYAWLKNSENNRMLNQFEMPAQLQQRLHVLSESVEGVFVLGKGCIIFDNSPVSAVNDANRLHFPNSKYQVISGSGGNLLFLFFLIAQAGCNVAGQWGDLAPYIQGYRVSDIKFSP